MANEQGGDVRELMVQIAKALVDEPEQVTVETSPGDDTTVLACATHPLSLALAPCFWNNRRPRSNGE